MAAHSPVPGKITPATGVLWTRSDAIEPAVLPGEPAGRALDLREIIQTAIGDAHEIVAALWKDDGDGSA